ncbi:MAG TPA: hypothetical protein VH593_17665 [Ktedonobacteraceae bacterium]
MGNEVRQRLFTRFGEMNFVPAPQRAPLFAQARFGIVGGVDEQCGRGKIVRLPPPQSPIFYPVVLDPNSAQELECRDVSEKGGASGSNTAVSMFHPSSPIPSASVWRSASDLGKRLSSIRWP